MFDSVFDFTGIHPLPTLRVKCEIKFRLAGVNSGTPDVISAQSRFLPCQLFQSAGVQGLAPGMK